MSENVDIAGITPITEDLAVGCITQLATSTEDQSLPEISPTPECFLWAPNSASSTVRPESGAGVEQRIFTGHLYDAETDLNYMEARYYGGNTARFLSADPAYLAVGTPGLKEKTGLELEQYLADPQAMNSYSYVKNNPLKYIDPTGEWLVLAALSELLLPTAAYAPVGENFENRSLERNITIASIALPGPGGEGKAAAKVAGEVIEDAGKTIINQTVRVANNFNLGQTVEGFGRVIENSAGKITGFFRPGAPNPYHGLDRIIERGINPQTLIDTVTNPLITFMQPNGNIYRLSEQAAVVLDKAGKLVTTYGKNEFAPKVLNILSKLKK